MLTFNREKFLVLSTILALSLLTYFISNISYSTNSVSNPVIIIVDSVHKFITLEKTPDEISRISQDIVIRNIEHSTLETK